MYHNDQWCMIHSGNVISTKCFKNYLAHWWKNIIKKQGMWISVSCYGSTPWGLLCRPRYTGQWKTARKLNLIGYYPSGVVFVGSLLGPSVLGKGWRLNQIISVPLPWTFVKVLHSADIYSFFFSLYHFKINFNSKGNFKTLLFLVSISIIKDRIFNITFPLLLRE